MSKAEVSFSLGEDGENKTWFDLRFSMPVNCHRDSRIAHSIASSLQDVVMGPAPKPEDVGKAFHAFAASIKVPGDPAVNMVAPSPGKPLEPIDDRQPSATPEVAGQSHAPCTRKTLAQLRCDTFNWLYPVGAELCMPALVGSFAQRRAFVAEPCRVIDADGEVPTCCVVMRTENGQKHFVSLSYVIGHYL